MLSSEARTRCFEECGSQSKIALKLYIVEASLLFENTTHLTSEALSDVWLEEMFHGRMTFIGQPAGPSSFSSAQLAAEVYIYIYIPLNMYHLWAWPLGKRQGALELNKQHRKIRQQLCSSGRIGFAKAPDETTQCETALGLPIPSF